MSDGIMIAYIPAGDTSWCKQPLPHMTLVYAGTLMDRDPTSFNRIAKDAISAARVTPSFALDVVGVEVFGDDEKVDVLRLESNSKLNSARRVVEHWSMSEHPFNPHCTIGPEGSAEGILPTRLYFDQILVAWGNRKLSFRLGEY